MIQVFKRFIVFVTVVTCMMVTPLAISAEDEASNKAQARTSSHGVKHSARHVVSSSDINPADIPFWLENRSIDIPKPSVSAQAEDSSVPAPRSATTTVKTGPDGKPQAASRGGSAGGSGGCVSRKSVDE